MYHACLSEVSWEHRFSLAPQDIVANALRSDGTDRNRKRLMFQWHPDRNPESRQQYRWHVIQEAWPFRHVHHATFTCILSAKRALQTGDTRRHRQTDGQAGSHAGTNYVSVSSTRTQESFNQLTSGHSS
eukprot:s2822_g14.t1